MKQYKGGYKIIDLEAKDITTIVTIDGIFNAIKNSYEKPLLFSRINVGGTKFNDTFADVKKESEVYTVTLYGVKYAIDEADRVISLGMNVLFIFKETNLEHKTSSYIYDENSSGTKLYENPTSSANGIVAVGVADFASTKGDVEVTGSNTITCSYSNLSDGGLTSITKTGTTTVSIKFNVVHGGILVVNANYN